MLFPSRAAIKSTAKNMLAPNWPQAIAIVFLIMGTILLPSFVTQLFDFITRSALSKMWVVTTAINEVYSFFFLWPLFFGVLRWFWNITAGERTPLLVIFIPFSSSIEYGRALKIGWAFFWRYQLASIPVYLVEVIKRINLPLPDGVDSNVLMEITSEAAQITTLLIFIFVLARLLPLPFVAINHPCRYVRDNVKESQIISKATAFQYLTLFASLGGWLLLSLLVIPLFYTLPYFLACWAVIVRFSINYCVLK